MSEISVAHFRAILSKETSNLEQQIAHWSNVLEQCITHEQANIEEGTVEDEEESGVIRSTIGQAKLLISKRFKQFSGLIDGCERNKGPLPTRLDDLLGFWEMISYQVDDVKKKFDQLSAERAKRAKLVC